jgi:hypothetical protein
VLRRVKGGAGRAQEVEKCPQNEGFRRASVDRVPPHVFALVDPWWTLRDVHEACSPMLSTTVHDHVADAAGSRCQMQRNRCRHDNVQCEMQAGRRHGPTRCRFRPMTGSDVSAQPRCPYRPDAAITTHRERVATGYRAARLG